MTSFYLDTSALVKLYIPETGSEWVDSIFREMNPPGFPVNQLAFAKIGIVEVAAAIARRSRMGEINAHMRLMFYKKFLDDSSKRYRLLDITKAMIYLAASLTQRLSLRGYDAVHLAAALTLNQHLLALKSTPLTFISADEDLCHAARSEGLSSDNPNQHA